MNDYLSQTEINNIVARAHAERAGAFRKMILRLFRRTTAA